MIVLILFYLFFLSYFFVVRMVALYGRALATYRANFPSADRAIFPLDPFCLSVVRAVLLRAVLL